MPFSKAIIRIATWIGVAGLVTILGCADMFKTTATGAGRQWRVVPQDQIGAFVDGDDVEYPVTVAWAKFTDERRLLPLEIAPDKALSDARTLSMRYMLNVIEGQPPRLAIVLFEKQGGVWFKVSSRPLVVFDPKKKVPMTLESLEGDSGFRFGADEVRLPLRGLKRAAFSQDTDGELKRDQVAKIWIGLVLDGRANGAMMIHDARFTNEP